MKKITLTDAAVYSAFIALMVVSVVIKPHTELPAPLAPLVHANIFHCLANLWVLLSSRKLLHVRLLEAVAAYIVSVLVLLIPWSQEIVGLSGAVYALLAIISPRLKLSRKGARRYHGWLCLFIIISIVVPSMAGWYHLLCYLAGLLVGKLIYRKFIIQLLV